MRAFDPALQSWTTPDAYEGDIRDPASQQRYMWNRGNAVDYSDPSGYDPCVGTVCLPSTAIARAAAAAARGLGTFGTKIVVIGGKASPGISILITVFTPTATADGTLRKQNDHPAANSSENEGKQDKKLTGGQVKNLEENTGEDVHDIKFETSGTRKGDLYLTSDGRVVHKPKGGKGPGNDTGHTRADLKTPTQ